MRRVTGWKRGSEPPWVKPPTMFEADGMCSVGVESVVVPIALQEVFVEVLVAAEEGRTLPGLA